MWIYIIMVRITEKTRTEDHAVPPTAERLHTGFNAASSQVSVESKHLLHMYYFNRVATEFAEQLSFFRQTESNQSC